MLRNHKDLVTFGKVLNLFRESSPLDKDVENSLCRIANFHSNIKYSTFRQSFTESRQNRRRYEDDLPYSQRNSGSC